MDVFLYIYELCIVNDDKGGRKIKLLKVCLFNFPIRFIEDKKDLNLNELTIIKRYRSVQGG